MCGTGADAAGLTTREKRMHCFDQDTIAIISIVLTTHVLLSNVVTTPTHKCGHIHASHTTQHVLGARLDKPGSLALPSRFQRLAQPTLLSNRLVSLIFCFTERFLSLLPDMLVTPYTRYIRHMPRLHGLCPAQNIRDCN